MSLRHNGTDATTSRLASIALLPLLLWYGCAPKDNRKPAAAVDARPSWEYPIRLGDAREKIHKLLGDFSRKTEVLEEYPASGVTVWFDPEGRVTKVNFQGEGAKLYTGMGSMIVPNWIPSDLPVVLGLTAHADETAFRRQLGSPVREDEAGSAKEKEVRLVWRKAGYIIDAQFLAVDRVYQGKTLSKGCLLWFEVSPGL